MYVDKSRETLPHGKALTTVVTTINTKRVLVNDRHMEAGTTTLEGGEVCKDMKEEKTESKKTEDTSMKWKIEKAWRKKKR